MFSIIATAASFSFSFLYISFRIREHNRFVLQAEVEALRGLKGCFTDCSSEISVGGSEIGVGRYLHEKRASLSSREEETLLVFRFSCESLRRRKSIR